MTFEDEMKEFWASLENLEDLVNEEQPKQKKRRTRKKKSGSKPTKTYEMNI